MVEAGGAFRTASHGRKRVLALGDFSSSALFCVSIQELKRIALQMLYFFSIIILKKKGL